MTDVTFLGPLHLEAGAHKRGAGMCAMEAAAYLAGEKHSDSPKCVSPVIAAFFRRLNDRLPDGKRQELKPYIPQVLHTRGTVEQERRRAWILVDWSIRDRLLWWCGRSKKLKSLGAELRALPELTDKVVYEREARALVQRVRDAADAAAAYADAAADAYADADAYAAAYAADAADAAADADADAADALLATLPSLVARLVVVTTETEPQGDTSVRGRRAGATTNLVR